MFHNTAVRDEFTAKPKSLGARCVAIREWRASNPEQWMARVLKFLFISGSQKMVLSKEYVGYLAREITKKLISGATIKTHDEDAVRERVHAALLDEMGVEDRINDEVRLILETYAEEMRRSGANYQEMFKKVKNELARKYKAVL
jgi:hypothetical protein